MSTQIPLYKRRQTYEYRIQSIQNRPGQTAITLDDFSATYTVPGNSGGDNGNQNGNNNGDQNGGNTGNQNGENNQVSCGHNDADFDTSYVYKDKITFTDVDGGVRVDWSYANIPNTVRRIYRCGEIEDWRAGQTSWTDNVDQEPILMLLCGLTTASTEMSVCM